MSKFMKEDIINVIISCDWWNTGCKSEKSFAPSSSIEEIAEYITKYLMSNSVMKKEGTI